MKIENKTHCKCGNEFPVHPVGYCGGSGYATLPDGEKICYPCADKLAKEELKDRSKPFLAYLANGIVTTWTGGKLGTVIRSRTIRLTRYSCFHGKTIESVKVQDIHGGLWIGQSNPGMAIKLRPVNS